MPGPMPAGTVTCICCIVAAVAIPDAPSCESHLGTDNNIRVAPTPHAAVPSEAPPPSPTMRRQETHDAHVWRSIMDPPERRDVANRQGNSSSLQYTS